MTAGKASLINIAVLLLGALWGYISANTDLLSVILPALIAVALMACNRGLSAEDKVIAHVAVTLTLAAFLILIWPLTNALTAPDWMAALRILAMMASCIYAKIYFIKSFRDARRAREAQAG